MEAVAGRIGGMSESPALARSKGGSEEALRTRAAVRKGTSAAAWFAGESRSDLAVAQLGVGQRYSLVKRKDSPEAVACRYGSKVGVCES